MSVTGKTITFNNDGGQVQFIAEPEEDLTPTTALEEYLRMMEYYMPRVAKPEEL
jgi:hypothetical protein